MDQNSLNCMKTNYNWCGSIQTNLFKPMEWVFDTQNWPWGPQYWQNIAQNSPKWIKKQFCGFRWIKIVWIARKTIFGRETHKFWCKFLKMAEKCAKLAQECAKKSITKSQRQCQYGNLFYGSDLSWKIMIVIIWF